MGKGTVDTPLDWVKKQFSKINSDKLEKVLLWENPNPTSDFATKTITIDGASQYEEFEIITHYHPTIPYEVRAKLINGGNTQFLYCNRTDMSMRNLSHRGDDFKFESGLVATYNSGSYSSGNNLLIPQKIYGYRCIR